jgi:hypothetical protein
VRIPAVALGQHVVQLRHRQLASPVRLGGGLVQVSFPLLGLYGCQYSFWYRKCRGPGDTAGCGVGVEVRAPHLVPGPAHRVPLSVQTLRGQLRPGSRHRDLLRVAVQLLGLPGAMLLGASDAGSPPLVPVVQHGQQDHRTADHAERDDDEPDGQGGVHAQQEVVNSGSHQKHLVRHRASG